MTFVFLDTETTGLNADLHSIWEIAYAVDDGPILSSFVAHSTEHADPTALSLNGYLERFKGEPLLGLAFEKQLRADIDGATLVGANPAFDARFLHARWGVSPWRYRLLDLEAYAMGVLNLDEPKGLKNIVDVLAARGAVVERPDHTAAADVAALRGAFRALRSIREAS